jgi:hypothetical protein
MKSCLCCRAAHEDDAHTCLRCGSADWQPLPPPPATIPAGPPGPPEPPPPSAPARERRERR